MHGLDLILLKKKASNFGFLHHTSPDDTSAIHVMSGGGQIDISKAKAPFINPSINHTKKTKGPALQPIGIGAPTTTPVKPLPDWQWLVNSMDMLGLGLEIWNEQGRLLAYNNKINALQAGLRPPQYIGKTYEEVIRMNLERHLIVTEEGAEKAWLAQRLLARGKHTEPFLVQLKGDHWVNLHETTTPDGFLMVVWVDLTNLVRKARVLEAINRELAHQSSTDGLTGLANRRRFDQALVTEEISCNHKVVPMSLLMVDIDHFKQYNDHYGHAAGDECLRSVASLLAKCTRRAGDLVARYGGEEFVIFLPGSDLKRAQEIARQCLAMLRKAAMPHAASPTSDRVSFSLGVASLVPQTAMNANLLLKAADRALYRAKESGRACYKVADKKDWDINCETTQHFHSADKECYCPTHALPRDSPSKAMATWMRGPDSMKFSFEAGEEW